MTPAQPLEGSPTGHARPFDHEQAEATPQRDPPPKGEVLVELLTDPWSVWCWGFEPVRRALEHRYPSIRFRFLLGGMFETLPHQHNPGFTMDRFFATVHRTTGMPVTTNAVNGHDQPTSTYPACIHIHAVRLIHGNKTSIALRKLREAAYLDGKNISNPATAQDVLENAGVDPDAFDEALDTGEPEREFKLRMSALEQQGLTAYPTLLVTGEQGTTAVHGFQPLPRVVSLAEEVSGKVHPSMPAPPLEEVLTPKERWSTREVAEALDESLEHTLDRLTTAEEDGWVQRERYPTGDVWTAVESP